MANYISHTNKQKHNFHLLIPHRTWLTLNLRSRTIYIRIVGNLFIAFMKTVNLKCIRILYPTLYATRQIRVVTAIFLLLGAPQRTPLHLKKKKVQMTDYEVTFYQPHMPRFPLGPAKTSFWAFQRKSLH